jgi:hypothetical protein
MPEARKRPCAICRRWFRPNPRVGDRQRACGSSDCQKARRQKTQANWRNRNPGYSIRMADRPARGAARSAGTAAITPPLNQLPREVAKDQLGPQGADFIGVMGALIVRTAKDQIRPYLTDPTAVPGTLPSLPQKTSAEFPHTRMQPPDHAPGVSPTRPEIGAPASP